MKTKASLTSIRMTLFCSILSANIAMAGNPVVCTPGYYDATCNAPISRPYQTPATCSTGPGWTTVASASWIGSQWTAPQCSYTPPPTCAPGYDQTGAPWWNGSSWVGLSCQPSAPKDPSSMCNAQVPAEYTATGSWNAYDLTDPTNARIAAQAASVYGIPAYTNVFTRSYDGPTYSLPCYDRNNWGAACYVNGSNVVGVIMAQASSASSGACNH